MRNYVVVRGFHLGQANINLTAGDKLQWDGEELFLERTSKSYSADTLRLAITAQHVVEDDGEVEFKAPVKVERPKPNIIIHDHEDMVVAKVNLPDKIAGRNRRTTEDVAKTTHKDAKKRVIVGDQRVVGSAIRPKKTGGQSSMVSTAEAEKIASEQNADARVVTAGDQRRTRIQELMAKEGLGTGVQGSGLPVTMDGDGGAVVVAQIKSAAEREKEQRENARSTRASAGESAEMTAEERVAFEADLELARAKRDGRAPAGVQTAPEAPEGVLTKKGQASKAAAAEPARLLLDDDGYPLGFPVQDHWRRRLQWCKDNAAKHDAMRIVYRRATESFQSRLGKEFPEIEWE